MEEKITNQVLWERLNTLMADNKEQHERIFDSLSSLKSEYESRLRALEDWKLVFVAKYSVYSAIALFLGSIIAQIGFQLITKYI